MSRGLSRAAPPERRPQSPPDPGEIAAAGGRVRTELAFSHAFPAGIPPGCAITTRRTVPGGVAPLNHRLMALKPPAWCASPPALNTPASNNSTRSLCVPEVSVRLVLGGTRGTISPRLPGFCVNDDTRTLSYGNLVPADFI